MKRLLSLVLLLLLSLPLCAQTDTLPGFQRKAQGEEIAYFSPMHQFAPTALLTRCNGDSPISWEAPAYTGTAATVTYELLMGHSTGTSSADRSFLIHLNGNELITLRTPMKQRGPYTLQQFSAAELGYRFIWEEHDIHQDGFGRLYITVPAAQVRQKAVFTVTGVNENSRDWLMIFMYRPGFSILAQPTQLVTRAHGKRQLNLFVDNPGAAGTPIRIQGAGLDYSTTLHPHYNKLSIPAWDPDFTGETTLTVTVPGEAPQLATCTLHPIRPYTFHIIHHSHNDIGYSHLQPEVEAIQNENIATALRWFQREAGAKAYWHVESLWAVENFLRRAGPEEEAAFVAAVRSGQLVLSASYANLMTGLCRSAELPWALEYAARLRARYGFSIRTVMITDVPGITWAGLNSFTDAGISYLCLGPNYIPGFPDKGDRVGNLLRGQGDKAFYWKPDAGADRKLLVWTAGKGYSFFHGIPDGEKEQAWEQRISDYMQELTAQAYPWDMVQLHYTKKSDNGPVDTTLTAFVADWNARFSSPRLEITSADSLFQAFETAHGAELPVLTGEISPYWEDGAYSTAAEEMACRVLVRKTLDMEAWAQVRGQKEALADDFYRLHRHLVLFHEHTWGSWCSIHDPENPFTTRQWEIKKSFLDSAQADYEALAAKLFYPHQAPAPARLAHTRLRDFTVDEQTGGVTRLDYGRKEFLSFEGKESLLQPVYMWGVQPMEPHRAQVRAVVTEENSRRRKVVRVTADLPSMPGTLIRYTLDRKAHVLTAEYEIQKKAVREKESLHLSIPYAADGVLYGSGGQLLDFVADALPGSNRDFACVEDRLHLVCAQGPEMVVHSPEICLYEIGGITDETLENGVRTWKTQTDSLWPVYAYVLNNYWHTNFKAWQEGPLRFRIEISLQ